MKTASADFFASIREKLLSIQAEIGNRFSSIPSYNEAPLLQHGEVKNQPFADPTLLPPFINPALHEMDYVLPGDSNYSSEVLQILWNITDLLVQAVTLVDKYEYSFSLAIAAAPLSEKISQNFSALGVPKVIDDETIFAAQTLHEIYTVVEELLPKALKKFTLVGRIISAALIALSQNPDVVELIKEKKQVIQNRLNIYYAHDFLRYYNTLIAYQRWLENEDLDISKEILLEQCSQALTSLQAYQNSSFTLESFLNHLSFHQIFLLKATPETDSTAIISAWQNLLNPNSENNSSSNKKELIAEAKAWQKLLSLNNEGDDTLIPAQENIDEARVSVSRELWNSMQVQHNCLQEQIALVIRTKELSLSLGQCEEKSDDSHATCTDVTTQESSFSQDSPVREICYSEEDNFYEGSEEENSQDLSPRVSAEVLESAKLQVETQRKHQKNAESVLIEVKRNFLAAASTFLNGFLEEARILTPAEIFKKIKTKETSTFLKRYLEIDESRWVQLIEPLKPYSLNILVEVFKKPKPVTSEEKETALAYLKHAIQQQVEKINQSITASPSLLLNDEIYTSQLMPALQLHKDKLLIATLNQLQAELNYNCLQLHSHLDAIGTQDALTNFLLKCLRADDNTALNLIQKNPRFISLELEDINKLVETINNGLRVQDEYFIKLTGLHEDNILLNIRENKNSLEAQSSSLLKTYGILHSIINHHQAVITRVEVKKAKREAYEQRVQQLAQIESSYDQIFSQIQLTAPVFKEAILTLLDEINVHQQQMAQNRPFLEEILQSGSEDLIIKIEEINQHQIELERAKTSLENKIKEINVIDAYKTNQLQSLKNQFFGDAPNQLGGVFGDYLSERERTFRYRDSRLSFLETMLYGDTQKARRQLYLEQLNTFFQNYCDNPSDEQANIVLAHLNFGQNKFSSLRATGFSNGPALNDKLLKFQQTFERMRTHFNQAPEGILESMQLAGTFYHRHSLSNILEESELDAEDDLHLEHTP